MKKLMLVMALLVGMTGFGFADAAFEALHPRDSKGRFVEKEKKAIKGLMTESNCPELKGAVVGQTVGIVVDDTRKVEFDVQTQRNESGDRVKKSLRVGESTAPAYFSIGPLDLNVPFITGKATYLYNFKSNQNMIGMETPFATLFGKLETTVGVVTSIGSDAGKGVPFLGGNVLLKNMLDKVVALPEDFSIGAFISYDWNTDKPMYGLKANLRLWSI